MGSVLSAMNIEPKDAVVAAKERADELFKVGDVEVCSSAHASLHGVTG